MKNLFLNCSLRKAALISLFLGICTLSFAQHAISGKVVDVSGEPVIGASVVVQGSTTIGAVVDLNGDFKLNVPDGTTLVVSCIGYADREIPVTRGQDRYNIVLSEDNEMLEETVVIGYGTARVRDLTGSVSTVSSNDLDVPVSNVAQALQGKMAGVVVSMNDGSPGAAPQIRVRGSKSITQTNDPLYIVDGFPVSNLQDIPVDQIKSINVLKDAAATAIYGSRGAAGVVLVQTKNAIEGQTTVSYNGYVQIKDSSYNIQKVMQPLDYLKFTLGYARDFANYNYTNMLNYFGLNDSTIGIDNGNHFSSYANARTHNYQEDIYKTGITHSHNLTVSTGTKKNRVMFSLNYLHDDGTEINSFYNRINTSLKAIQNVTDRLSLELNASYSYTSNRGAHRSAEAFWYKPIDNPAGDVTNTSGFGNGSSYIEDESNPVELAWNSQNTSAAHGLRGIAAINYKPIDALNLRSEIGLGANFGKNMEFSNGFGSTYKSAALTRSDSNSLHWTTTAQYTIPFRNDDHRADVMVGNELIRSNGSSMYFYGYEYPEHFTREQAFAFMDQFDNNYTYKTSYNMPGRALSFFGRANYAFKDRYLLTATFRADGSSKFAPNNRWGYFPAAAFAWRVIDEPFMAGTKDWLSNLKLRLSWGVTGSDAISANLWRETWELASGNTSYTISEQETDTEKDYGRPYSPGNMMMNNDLKWESTVTRNLGVDFGFLDDRFYGTVEGYWSTTNDLLMPVSINSSTGYTYQYQNMGVVSNKGIELTLGGDLVRTSDFTLSANFIYNYNVNRIEDLAESIKVNTYGQWVSSERAPINGEFILKEGMAMGTVMAYKYLGWYTTSDFNYDAATGVYTLKDGVPDFELDSYWTSLKRAPGQTAFPGTIKFEDLNEDGALTNDDTYIVGEMTPRSTGAFNLEGRWKNLDFSANFNYVIGGMIMNYEALMSQYGAKDNRFGANRLEIVSGAYTAYRWGSNGELEFVSTPEELDALNKNATMHSPTSMKGFLIDSFLEDASYLRLKNLTVGYTLPKNFTTRFGVKNLRLYFTATNLFTLTGYSGLNPEVNTSRSSSYGFPTPGIDRNAYPMAKAYTFGLNVTF
ncbi:MAG: TonB-dependent receptor [Bacteroidales bacterium]|nr:TonB-dependent receptor [Bacteroidales bacterium]